MITPALCGTVEEILGDLEQWKRKGELQEPEQQKGQ